METKTFKFSLPMSPNKRKKVDEMLSKIRRQGIDYEVYYGRST